MVVGQFVSFGMGGADKASYCLTKGLLELGVQVVVFYNNNSFPKNSPQIQGKVLCRYDQFVSLGMPMVFVDNASDLNNYGVSILNTHRSGDDFWLIPGLESIKPTFKIVETNFHGNLFTKADIRVFPSYEMLNGKYIHVPYRVIPNPIMIKLTDKNLKVSLGIEDKFVFGSFGRPGNDIYSSTSINAFKLLNRDEAYFLYIAPHGKVLSDVNELKLNNFKFIDASIDDYVLDALYNTVDVVCHANIMGETFGNTVAEAMIHGKPVISHWGSPQWPQAQKEVIGDDNSMYICNNDVGRYKDLMYKLLIDKDAYNSYATYAKKRADDLYDYRIITKQYVEVYNNL